MTAQFQQARWNEPLLSDIGTPGERGFVPSAPEAEITAQVPDALSGTSCASRRRPWATTLPSTSVSAPAP
jgi:glycine dehydrogenase subunit 2